MYRSVLEPAMRLTTISQRFPLCPWQSGPVWKDLSSTQSVVVSGKKLMDKQNSQKFNNKPFSQGQVRSWLASKIK